MRKPLLLSLLFTGTFFYSYAGSWREELDSFPTPYQDIVINGKVVRKGLRECESRWRTVNHFLQGFEGRPFKMLDIGAAEGYFTFQAAFSYPESEYQMLEVAKTNCYRLRKILEWSGSPPNIYLVNSIFDARFPMETLKYEHYDVVLCFNVLHHMHIFNSDSVEDVLAKLKSIGSHLLIETPGDLGCEVLEVIRKESDAKLLGTYSRHTSESGKGYLFYLPGKRVE